MKKILVMSLLAFTSLVARDDLIEVSIAQALNSPKAVGVVDKDISLSFGTGTSGDFIVKNITSNKKTNAANKSDEEACTWAFLSAVKAFQDRARKEGGTKVVNLTSYYKKNDFNSKTHFQCGAGNIMAGVTLKGDIAK